jgi:Cu+-exporting ATPase
MEQEHHTEKAADSCCHHGEHKAGASQRVSAVEAAEYTCPMHPEVISSEPGDCPKCGMALEPVAPARPATRTEYTCPMHPEVVRDEPGSCPKCGMALEPRTVTIDEAESDGADSG